MGRSGKVHIADIGVVVLQRHPLSGIGTPLRYIIL